MPPESWHLLESGPGPTPLNMAWDEVLLENVSSLAAPVLRFYAWEEPAASFGYFQRHADVARMTPLRPLVRRPTGGGLVPHDADWTYSLVFPPGHAWYGLRAEESYRQLHEWVQAALNLAGAKTDLSPCCAKELPGQCFAGPEKHDLLLGGRKVAGAAQRRAKHGLLIQGSIQPRPPGMVRGAWERGFLDSAIQRWGVEWRPLPGMNSLATLAAELSARKYAQASHNEKR
ncbi:MAG TPA: lipoate--protein ligase family protein [Verrucomicrobiales bacterium]|nr:lipoate--protein ligase family protein [Verrucomicrobiales bacterium]